MNAKILTVQRNIRTYNFDYLLFLIYLLIGYASLRDQGDCAQDSEIRGNQSRGYTLYRTLRCAVLHGQRGKGLHEKRARQGQSVPACGHPRHGSLSQRTEESATAPGIQMGLSLPAAFFRCP